ncbi:MAG: hypothetical protein ABFC96_02535 [Thermoguttaceae bacterium]
MRRMPSRSILFILFVGGIILVGVAARKFPGASETLNGIALIGLVGSLFGATCGIAKYGTLFENEHEKCAGIGGFIGMAIGLPLATFFDLGFAPILAMGIGAAAVIAAVLVAVVRQH